MGLNSGGILVLQRGIPYPRFLSLGKAQRGLCTDKPMRTRGLTATVTSTLQLTSLTLQQYDRSEQSEVHFMGDRTRWSLRLGCRAATLGATTHSLTLSSTLPLEDNNMYRMSPPTVGDTSRMAPAGLPLPTGTEEYLGGDKSPGHLLMSAE